MNKNLLGQLLVGILLCLHTACLSVDVDDAAGDWVIYNWSTSTTNPGIVNTAKIRIDPVENTAFLVEVPPNDWGYEVDDVVFSDLSGFRGELVGMTTLRYLPLNPITPQPVTLRLLSQRSIIEVLWTNPNTQEEELMMTMLRLDLKL